MADGRTHATRSGAWGRRALVAAAIGWLALAIGLPFASVFAAAFAPGLRAFGSALATPAVLHAAYLSLLAMLVAMAFNVVFGVAAAWAVERTTLPGRKLIASLLDLPIAVSPVVAGLMFLLLFGRQGWLGDPLDSAGIKIVFATPGILIATAFVTLPFVAKEVIAVLRESGTADEEAARTLGAGAWQTFVAVVLPKIRWAIFYGLVLTAARALGEFGAVSVLSGNLVGQTQTLPLYIEQAYVNYQSAAAFAAAVPLTLLAVATIGAQKLVGWYAGRERGRRMTEETA